MLLRICKASQNDSRVVSSMVASLLKELEPNSIKEIETIDFDKISLHLLGDSKITALIAYDHKEPIGLVTLHECAAIYAGGLFGEISEFYVQPTHRSLGVGQKLLQAAENESKKRNWVRIEVGAPSAEQWPRTLQFYRSNNFYETGPRLRKILNK